MLNTLHRIARHIGRRGASAGIFAAVFFTVGFSYVLDSPTQAGAQNLEFLTRFLGLQTWGWLWIVAAILLLGCVVYKRLESIAFTAAMVLSFAWSSGILVQTLLGSHVRCYVSAALYLLITAFVYIISDWVEPKYLKDETEVDE